MMLETESYMLPAHWACPLMYDDYTGLTDEDERELERFLKEAHPGYCVDVIGEEDFTPWHDAPGVLPCMVQEFVFHKVAEHD